MNHSSKVLFWHVETTHVVLPLVTGLCHAYFLGKTWSENMKLSKLTKIWYRGTLLDFQMILMFVFSNFL